MIYKNFEMHNVGYISKNHVIYINNELISNGCREVLIKRIIKKYRNNLKIISEFDNSNIRVEFIINNHDKSISVERYHR